MSRIIDAADRIEALLATVADLTVVRDLGSPLGSLPAAVIGVPSLTWSAESGEPTDADWPVILVVDANSEAVDRLWRLVIEVGTAIDDNDVDVVLRQASPAVWSAGGHDLPAYELQMDVAL